MTRKDLALCLLVSWVCFVLPGPLLAQQLKKKELISRIEQLEKRIAELEPLEKRVAKLERLNKEAKAKATSQNKLVGNWAAGDEDRKVEGLCTDLKLLDDGTGKAVFTSRTAAGTT